MIQVAAIIEARYPKMSIITDIQQSPGDPVPPLINGFRPDVYANSKVKKQSTIIAEAKTDRDIDNSHTHKQVSSFINYLEKRIKGHFIFSVTGCGADRAKTILRFMYQELCTTHTILSVFDSHDLWSLDLDSGVKWHLISENHRH